MELDIDDEYMAASILRVLVAALAMAALYTAMQHLLPNNPGQTPYKTPGFYYYTFALFMAGYFHREVEVTIIAGLRKKRRQESAKPE